MSDTIYRQAAIDGKISVQRTNGLEIYSDEVVPVEFLKSLPPAQPEIIRCKDCKHTDEDGVCQNSKGLAIQDDDDFCSRAETR